MERGILDAKSMISKTCRLEETSRAVQDCADLTIIAGVVLII
jgi:hypothetical protein